MDVPAEIQIVTADSATEHKVVGFFTRINDIHWSEHDKTMMRVLYEAMGKSFFIGASRRQCAILAAVFREDAQNAKDSARANKMNKLATRCEEAMREAGRQEFYPHELTPASL